MFPDRIETERLLLEPRIPENVDYLELYEYCSDGDAIEEVTEHVTWEPHDHPKESLEFLEGGVDGCEKGTVADYAIRPRNGEPGAGDLAGFSGLRFEWDHRRAEMGIWLRKRFWGRGYSGERAGALLDLALGQLDLEVVRVTHHPDNENSRNAVEQYVDRFDGRREGRFRNAIKFADGSVHDQIAYSISQTEWREAVEAMAEPPAVHYEWDR
ncbi:GCN5-related N-acetyltransferase [Halalkaliarchaeum desulfuricum]|uniref:GCN5-related N-acetyltransferase n=1 Tax=Halalkaliarchaeum desulfuricum TaxID=2055893 RepID=A0A343TF76_9EURY|nr:GNAT family protein [Halalkaliarchaeum desulfuricum]AUX07748.1 GCN5-related N-acetyltransferase [Halalkaliarchaeum desulfuricum]